MPDDKAREWLMSRAPRKPVLTVLQGSRGKESLLRQAGLKHAFAQQFAVFDTFEQGIVVQKAAGEKSGLDRKTAFTSSAASRAKKVHEDWNGYPPSNSRQKEYRPVMGSQA
jgi:hypothetical protein